MTIKQYFDYDMPAIPADRVYEITEGVLDDLYTSLDDNHNSMSSFICLMNTTF